MITEQDLKEAIAECLGKRNPDASTCIKLAAFYTIRDQLYPDEPLEIPARSYSPPKEEPITLSGEQSEFMKAISGKNTYDVLTVMDELMDTLRVIHPRLYDGVMRKIE